MSVLIIFKLLGSLALLMFGMKSMSDSLQKLAGPQLRHVLGAMTTNRFTGVLTGMMVTASVQSSTATTVMTVSFVNAGLLTLAQAISVIMGANIGTTLTAWIMSAGFSFDISNCVYPAFLLGIVLIYLKKYRIVGDFIFGLSFLLLGLGTLRMTGIEMDLGNNTAILGFFSSFDPDSFLTTLTFLLLGGVLTFCVQSSAAVMAITMILCSTGALPIYQGIALVMGENIGTTITSNLAALSANTQARRAALAHLFFNVFGVIWVLIIFRPFINFTCDLVGVDPTASTQSPARLSFALAAFHTSFNVINTAILIGFIPQIERIVCWLIKPKVSETSSDDFKLRYIQGGIMRTPEIAVLQAQREVGLYSERTQNMFNLVQKLFDETDFSKAEKEIEHIEKLEDQSDKMEMEIARYLEEVSNYHLSDESKAKVRAMIRMISEIESIGDSCHNFARTLRHYYSSKEKFTDEQVENVRQMMSLANDSLTEMNSMMSIEREHLSIDRIKELEKKINNRRDVLKDKNITDVDNHVYSYRISTMYIDLICECEKLADYVLNVAEARLMIHKL
ncbi:MAG: Na/Pi cotransporter family protein [Muribaculaceae bacterium]|nr:Na/Pi cotransporter family protein [Muribaculaceae bacterium]